MSYEKEFVWDAGQFVVAEFSFSADSLKLDSWKIYRGFLELVPDRETAEEIEEMLANWLEKEYSKNAMNYISDMQDCLQEKRYEV